MIHLGANSVLFAGFDLETAMRHIHLAGYDGVELAAIKGMCEHLELDNWSAQASQIKELAEKYELKLLAMEEAALDEERLMRAFAAGAEIGIPVVNVGPGGKSDVEADGLFQAAVFALAENQAIYHDFDGVAALACVRRQRGDVAVLPFGVQGVKGQRGLARAGDAGEADQFVFREGELDVFEVVDAGTADDDILGFHGFV